MDGVRLENSFSSLRQWQKERRAKKKDLSYQVPQAVPDLDYLRSNREQVSITWIGHATFLIQIGGLNIVTDPVWANRMGFAKRLAPPGLDISRLPDMDVVLISHGHYDHLDFPSLRKLPGQPVVYAPVGLRDKLRRKGFKTAEEFSWWDKVSKDGVTFTFVPAQHWTRRTLTDTNTSHWGGWVICGRKPEPVIYFAGDSGYFRGFREIGKRFDIDYALMPIGAYEPEWFMAMQHVTPEEAVQALEDCRGKVMVPMHYGAFRLADDTPKEALDRLYAEWQRRGLPADRLRCLRHGETLRDE
ncbi:membrane protein [Paenibacillus sp. J2TS4]|nr:membrane protein [Paenibacillus sp. J2TS4]